MYFLKQRLQKQAKEKVWNVFDKKTKFSFCVKFRALASDMGNKNLLIMPSYFTKLQTKSHSGRSEN